MTSHELAAQPIPFTDPWEYELRFPRDPRGPRIARATLRTVLTAHGLGELSGRAELLTSELATNSVRYSDGPATVRLKWLHPVLRVILWDSSPTLPSQFVPPPDLERGRGLLILDVMADRWGGCANGEGAFGPTGKPGKSVWFELAWIGGGPPPIQVTAA